MSDIRTNFLSISNIRHLDIQESMSMSFSVSVSMSVSVYMSISFSMLKQHENADGH
jgi:hypothetical protein